MAHIFIRIPSNIRIRRIKQTLTNNVTLSVDFRFRVSSVTKATKKETATAVLCCEPVHNKYLR